MATDRRTPTPRADHHGVRVEHTATPRRDVWLVAIAAAALLAAALGVRSLLRGGSVARAPASPSDPVAAPVAPPAPPPAAAARPLAERAAPRPLARARARRRRDAAPSAERPELSAKDVIAALAASGERTGIAVFPPPGTDPVKRGIIVPEDFPLPEGYVRHYQTTDEGERLAAILMFSPDYEWVDASGAPLALPDDRIVPPEMAPPGLPIRLLDVPEPAGAPVPER